MSGIVIGVDPGLSGALGAINTQGEFVALLDMPVMRNGALAWVDPIALRSWHFGLKQYLAPGLPMKFVIERVSARPGQGVSGVFSFGVTFGSLLATIQSFAEPIELVMPGVWKRAVGLSGKAGKATAAKREALDRARLAFPTADLSLCKHEGRAEALLLAKYALDKSRGAAS